MHFSVNPSGLALQAMQVYDVISEQVLSLTVLPSASKPTSSA